MKFVQQINQLAFHSSQIHDSCIKRLRSQPCSFKCGRLSTSLQTNSHRPICSYCSAINGIPIGVGYDDLLLQPQDVAKSLDSTSRLIAEVEKAFQLRIRQLKRIQSQIVKKFDLKEADERTMVLLRQMVKIQNLIANSLQQIDERIFKELYKNFEDYRILAKQIPKIDPNHLNKQILFRLEIFDKTFKKMQGFSFILQQENTQKLDIQNSICLQFEQVDQKNKSFWTYKNSVLSSLQQSASIQNSFQGIPLKSILVRGQNWKQLLELLKQLDLTEYQQISLVSKQIYQRTMFLLQQFSNKDEKRVNTQPAPIS